MNILSNIRIVLCNTSHQGNIGAAARAMKTMGIYNLVLVNPIATPDDHAIALSSNASDVVEQAKIATSLTEALENTTLAFALTARKREFQRPLLTPKESMPQIFAACNSKQQVAIVFGSEKYGLSIEELEKCNRMLTIPGNPEYFSLNLAQAVQIMCYEIYSNYNSSLAHLKQTVEKATFAATQGLLNHIDETLSRIDFYKNRNIERTKRRLQNIIHKADLERDDIDLLRGILKSIDYKLN